MKLGRLISCAAIGAALTVPAFAQPNLLIDGNFDNGTSGTQVSGSPWVLSANLPDGVNNGAQFQTGFANAQNTGAGGPQAPGTGTGIWFRTFEGNQGGSGEALVDASLTQTIVAPRDGDYVLDFVAGREVNFTAQEYSVTLSSSGGQAAGTIDLLTQVIPDGNLGGGASPNQGGTPFSVQVLGVNTGDILTVTARVGGGADSQIPGGQSGFLDSFSLVPEPTSAALLAGLAGTALLRRRSA